MSNEYSETELTPEASQPQPYDNQNNPANFGKRGVQVRDSYLGPHDYQREHGVLGGSPQDTTDDEDKDNDQEEYGLQDQFGDVDGQDPYNNLEDQDPGQTAGGEGLYDLEEPLAQSGEQSIVGRQNDQYGTRGSQDQYGYQK